jgi:hypothetical protein
VLHALAKHAPFKSLRRLTYNIDTMYDVATRIWAEKKAAFESGEGVVREQAGGGKDIMSVLRKYKPYILLRDAYQYFTCLVRANMEASAKDRLSEEHLIQQMK